MHTFCQEYLVAIESKLRLGYVGNQAGVIILFPQNRFFNSVKLQGIKLFSKLDIETNDDDIMNDCCIFDSEKDLELVELF